MIKCFIVSVATLLMLATTQTQASKEPDAQACKKALKIAYPPNGAYNTNKLGGAALSCGNSKSGEIVPVGGTYWRKPAGQLQIKSGKLSGWCETIGDFINDPLNNTSIKCSEVVKYGCVENIHGYLNSSEALCK